MQSPWFNRSISNVSKKQQECHCGKRGNATEDEGLEVTGGEGRTQVCQDFGFYGQSKDMQNHAYISKIPLSEEHR